MKLNVNEIFYSLQGEGGRVGEPSVFVRLAKCNLSCDFCDTEYENGEEKSLDEILSELEKYPSKWIIWTGGEPTLQLKNEHLQFFTDRGYKHAIETNGTRQIPSLIDYITCSPKVNIDKVLQKVPFAHEIRMPLAKGDPLPNISILPKANKYFISPIFNDEMMNIDNVNYCIDLVKANPDWTLSLQIHKLLNIE